MCPRPGKSFRAGLETAVLAWIAIYVGTFSVEIPQALAWYNAEGILLLDGEGAAGAGVDAIGAVALRVARRFGMLRATEARHSNG